ncbi:lipopolysaccharide kinase InaA family protein [Pseudomonas sp. UBA2684]|uniref:lipopolysaccharide kinase InaA family protein n=1 Tax=Pseudomonas sp. UBA2684 TaxID=1947311 RepID=UPI000E9D67D5|nr:lipopolysaccharide kinase InaA family protein [Pseudomonas sp. UBA2684]HBX57099.1 serine/threonine protein kinase [Pseudomonas sp.]|tara:strand:+ start:4673 stop:6130 length:1458 start_codon:yes stop_codon:yes gene_type:complete
MRLSDVRQAGRTPTLPMQVTGLAGDTLQVQRLLRVLPGQRYVGVAQWQGRRVLAKLLVGAKAERHFAREVAGARLLAEQGLRTPALLEQGFSAGEGGWLLFDFLADARSLGEEWAAQAAEPLLSDTQRALLGEALAVIAALHLQGLWQDDLHLDNLLRHDGQLFLIDGGGVRVQTPGKPLSRDQVLANLGVFFAQLPASLEAFIEELLVHYLLVNGEHALPLEALLDEVGKVRRWRLRDYLRKVGRDCSLFSVQRNATALRVVRRTEEQSLAPLLSDPDAALAAGQALKLGGSSTVALVEHQGRALVIKRYNIKGVAHWLKRCWRPSRAWHSWCEGNRLDFLGIATPRPLAMLELRTCWLRRRAYLVTEHAAGEDIIARFTRCPNDPDAASLPPEAELAALDELFAALLRERISHGDLKGTNLLWQAGRWALIDLDAMRQHRSASSFAPAYSRDRARFLRNWPAGSALHQLLDRRLPKVDIHAAV